LPSSDAHRVRKNFVTTISSKALIITIDVMHANLSRFEFRNLSELPHIGHIRITFNRIKLRTTDLPVYWRIWCNRPNNAYFSSLYLNCKLCIMYVTTNHKLQTISIVIDYIPLQSDYLMVSTCFFFFNCDIYLTVPHVLHHNIIFVFFITADILGYVTLIYVSLYLILYSCPNLIYFLRYFSNLFQSYLYANTSDPYLHSTTVNLSIFCAIFKITLREKRLKEKYVILIVFFLLNSNMILVSLHHARFPKDRKEFIISNTLIFSTFVTTQYSNIQTHLETPLFMVMA
ncbi:hypothetical protein L9F63_009670, partial [Diploptera punctata]